MRISRSSLLLLAVTICALHAVPSVYFPRRDVVSASQAPKIRQELRASGNIYAQRVTVKVPPLKGETIHQARQTLDQVHLVPGPVYGDNPKGLICDQRPHAGEDALRGSKVSLWTVCQAVPSSTEVPPPKLADKEGLAIVPDLHSYSNFFAAILLA